MPILLLVVLGGLVVVAGYEVYASYNPSSPLVPWWHPAVGPALQNTPSASDPATQDALTQQALAQAAQPAPAPAPAPAGPKVISFNFVAANRSTVQAWRSQVNATATQISNSLPITAPDPASQVQRQLLNAWLTAAQSPTVTKAQLQSAVVNLMNPASGADSVAAGVQLQALLASAPAGA